MNKVKSKSRWMCKEEDFVDASGFEWDREKDKPYDLSESWLHESLEEKLEDLRKFQCNPSIYLRGNKWRVHINAGTNIWEDGSTPDIAFKKAYKKWVKDGRPTARAGAIQLWVREHTHVKGKRSWKTHEIKWRII